MLKRACRPCKTGPSCRGSTQTPSLPKQLPGQKSLGMARTASHRACSNTLLFRCRQGQTHAYLRVQGLGFTLKSDRHPCTGHLLTEAPCMQRSPEGKVADTPSTMLDMCDFEVAR